MVEIISDIRSRCPGVGTRKLQHMLSDHFSISYGRDRLFELLDKEKMLLRQRHRAPRTTWSGHIFPTYPNLVRDIIPTRPNEVWVSDITYIKIDNEFLYLFLITDMYSRKIVGWELASDMQATHAIKALRQALEQKGESKLPTIHHSDRGSQYCCSSYVAELRQSEILISMTEKGDPRENAYAERINGTLKNEFLKKLNPTEETARTMTQKAIEAYNHIRPHSSIGYMTPAKAHTQTGPLKRLWKTYPWYRTKVSAQSNTFVNNPTTKEVNLS